MTSSVNQGQDADTADPLPACCFVTYWVEVYIRGRYPMMAPMESDWRAQLSAGASFDAVRAPSIDTT